MPKKAYVKVSGAWKTMYYNYVKVSGVWKYTKALWVRVSGVWKETGVAGIIPDTGIIPFVGSSVPAGFSRYTGADGKFIIGAGSTYTVGATSTGSGTVSKSGTTNTTGAHSGGSRVQQENTNTHSWAGDTSAGGHSHTFSGLNINTLDICKDFILIQANGNQIIPINGVMLAHQAITTTLSEIETSTNRFLRSNTTYGGTAGNSSPSGAAGTSSNGSHIHGSLQSSGTSTLSPKNTSAGAHSHTVTGTYTLATKYKYLQFLADSVATALVSPGCIIMWPTATPPNGWVVCDGTSGTPDMRDYYLKVGNSTNRNTSGGNNSAAINYTSNSAGGHQHSQQTGNGSGVWMYHTNTLGAHSHSFSGGSDTITQPYTALTFIMKE